jgi:type I restriction enzyme S subunit
MKLKDIVTPVTSQLKLSDVNNEGKYVVYGASGKCGYLDSYKIDENYVAIVKDGAGVGRVHKVDAKESFLGTMQGLVPNANIHRDYVYYLLKYLNLGASFNGATVPHIYFKDYGNKEINQIAFTDQVKISDYLSKLEIEISLLKNKLVYLDELVKSRFIEQFGDPNSNPNNYPMKTLNEIAEYWNGLTYKPADVSKVGQGTLVLRSSNIQNSSLAFEDNVYVNCNIKEKHYVKENDILMCSRNGSARLVGKVALIKGLETKTSFGAFMMIIRSNYYPYLKAYFENDAFRSQLATSTATINQITSKMLDAVKIPVPPMELVKDFENYTQQIDKLKFVCYSRYFL